MSDPEKDLNEDALKTSREEAATGQENSSPGEDPAEETFTADQAAPDSGAAQEQFQEPPPAHEGSPAEPAARPAAESGATETAGSINAGELQRRLEESEDKLLRLHAEFDNYKKRNAKQHAESLKYALTPVLQDLITLMDNLERAVDHARKDQGEGSESLLEGVEMVRRQLAGVFEKYGLSRIDAVGKPFDPNVHEAMSIVETDTMEENHVAEEFQAGYFLHDRVVRPAMVTVSKRPDNKTG
ncbi:MAG: nucleotide exchange factor GrpE [Deltaproteobacteria bacterium]|nr:nucleotide exchange factor GrpE [Deltaproteobacteria bacterium]